MKAIVYRYANLASLGTFDFFSFLDFVADFLAFVDFLGGAFFRDFLTTRVLDFD